MAADIEWKLGRAISDGDAGSVKWLLAQAPSMKISITGMERMLYKAAIGYRARKDMVMHLLDHGADVNAVGGEYGTALAAAAWQGNKDIVSLLLDRGADVDTVGGKYGTALAAAAYWGNMDIVSLLLHRGADVNAVGGEYGTTLSAAAWQGSRDIVSLLLERGADVNYVGGEYGTALTAAAYWGNMDIVSLLLDQGADVNAVGGEYGTALAAAAWQGSRNIVSLLLDRGAYVNTVGGEYGTALTAAAYWGNMDIVSLLLDRGSDVNAVGGEYGTALAAAAREGKSDTMSLLLGRGADVNAVGGKYGTPLAAAVCGRESDVGLVLLLQHGADLNMVVGEYGSALGLAIHEGDEERVELFLDQGTDPLYVGGRYDTPDGSYPTALHALDHAKRTTQRIRTLIESSMNRTLNNIAGPPTSDLETTMASPCCPPFPMPYAACRHDSSLSITPYYTQVIRSGQQSPSSPDFADSQFPTQFRAREPIASPQASVSCRDLSEQVLNDSLVALVGVTRESALRLKGWIQNDIRFFTSQNLDFGLAYAAARVGWRAFNEQALSLGNPDAQVSIQRHQWFKHCEEFEKVQASAMYTDNMQELIHSPYSVMPRRLWDLKSNRVVSYGMLHGQIRSTNASKQYPTFWAITHSWTESMVGVETPINQYQWPVPLPRGVSLEDIRSELLGFGAEYIWVDVLCLRQRSENPALEKIRADEWKIDVPTIGNIYRAAEIVVRYFNGLGMPFSNEGWDNPRHWLRQAWKLQECTPEHMTFNGGVQLRTQKGIILNAVGEVGGKRTTLRRALLPVLNLISELHSPGGCSMYQLAREMSKRYASQLTDKVSGLLYLLRVAKLPTYSETTSAEAAWNQCLNVLPVERQVEIIFDFPYRGTGPQQQLFPTWEQIMGWPERNPDYQHSTTQIAQNTTNIGESSHPKRSRTGEAIPLGNNEDRAFWIPNVLALSHARLHAMNDPGEYEVQSGDRSFGFYCPYLLQEQIETSDRPLTLVTFALGQAYNWVVCEEVSGEDHIQQLQAYSASEGSKGMKDQVKVLKKIGVLRTDSGIELLVLGINQSDSILRRIDCLLA